MSWRRVTTRLAAIGLLLTLATTLASPASAVTFGSPVARPTRSAPWALSLYRADAASDRARLTCTATALSGRQVLTAAHCVTDRAFYFVKVGADRLSGGTLVPVEAIFDNSRYTRARTTNDIALLRPLTPLNLSSYAHLGTPAQARKINSSGAPALTIFGWGETQIGRITNRLVSARLESRPQAAAVAYGSDFQPSLMVAASHYNRAARTYSGGCHGDSGGPLVLRFAGVPYVVGVTSFGAGCQARVPTVFTSVGAYRSWITRSKLALPRAAISNNRALPVNLVAPAITGTPAVGATLSCDPGSWSVNTNETVPTWSVGSAPTPVGAGATYAVRPEDAGSTLTCTVNASSDAGTRSKASAPVIVPAAAPLRTSPATQTAGATQG